MPRYLDIATNHTAQTIVVHVGGEVDMVTAPELESAIAWRPAATTRPKWSSTCAK